jgi:hypothetical protein
MILARFFFVTIQQIVEEIGECELTDSPWLGKSMV